MACPGAPAWIAILPQTIDRGEVGEFVMELNFPLGVERDAVLRQTQISLVSQKIHPRASPSDRA